MTAPQDALNGLSRRLRRLGRNDQVILSALSLIIGVAAGLAAIGFREAIDLVQWFSFGFRGETVASLARELVWWHLLLVPSLGGLAIGLFVYHFMPERRPLGVAQVIEASALHGGRMSLTTGIKAAIVSSASIGFGASVGREGPMVHLGASLAAWVARRLHLGRSLSRTLLGCGVAAAIAASFNAPIAGVFFALEVVIGHYGLSAFAPIVIAGVTGTLVSRSYYGDAPAFVLPEEHVIASVLEFPAFALLGAVSAAAAIIMMRSIFFAQDVIAKTPIPPWGRPAVGGLLVGAIAVFYPEVLGVGYEATNAALMEDHTFQFLLILVVAKTAATALSLGAGFGGGVFSPSLFLGAMIGGAFGIIATEVFPHLSSGHGAYTMIGMGAVAGAVLGAPISTILMIFELTNDYKLTIAVMIATVIASVVTQALYGRSFFALQLERQGVSIKGGQDIGLLKALTVESLMDTKYDTIAPDTPLAEVRRRLLEAKYGELFMVDEDGRLTGTIIFSDLRDTAVDTSHDDDWVASNVARKQPAVLRVTDDLATAVELFGASGETHLPVVETRTGAKLIGVAHEHEVVLAYHRALQRQRDEERGDL